MNNKGANAAILINGAGDESGMSARVADEFASPDSGERNARCGKCESCKCRTIEQETMSNTAKGDILSRGGRVSESL